MHCHNSIARWFRSPVIYSLLVNGVLIYGLMQLTAHRASPETRIEVDLPALTIPHRPPMKRTVTRIPPIVRQPLIVPPLPAPKPIADAPHPVVQLQQVNRPVVRPSVLPLAKPPVPIRNMTTPVLALPSSTLPTMPVPAHDLPRESVRTDSSPASVIFLPNLSGMGGNHSHRPSAGSFTLSGPSGPGGGAPMTAPGGSGSGGPGGNGHGNGTGNGSGDGQGNGHGNSAGHGTGTDPGTASPHPKGHGTTCSASITYQSKPLYPPGARRDGVEGTVVLRVTITPKGKPGKVEVQTSSGDTRIDDSALQSVVKEWSYAPRRENGEAIASTIVVRVKFSLSDEE